MPRTLHRWAAPFLGFAALPAAAAPVALPPRWIYLRPVWDQAQVMRQVPVRGPPSDETELAKRGAAPDGLGPSAV